MAKATAVATQEQGGVLAKQAPYQLVPTNFNEAMQLANLMADSDLVPKDFKGKPGNCFLAMQMGAELGLSPMQALQGIAIINGRPSVWGDAMLALCQSKPYFEWIDEHFEPDGTAVCTVKRKNYEPHTTSFSDKDAVRGGYDKKPGPWQTSYTRMKQMRARAFALRDRFADALKGVAMVEEAIDLDPIEVSILKPEERTRTQASKILHRIGVKQEAPEEIPDSHNGEIEGGHEPGDTNIQGEFDYVDLPSSEGGSEGKEGYSGENLYPGSPDDIFQAMMGYFDQDKSRVSAFVKELLGNDRMKKWGDIKTLTQEEMTVLWNGMEKLKAEGE